MSAYIAPTDLKTAVFEVPTGPIVSPVFDDLAAEDKYWQVMKRWYITELRQVVFMMEAESDSYSYEEVDVSAVESAQVAELSALDKLDCSFEERRKRKCVINNKWGFRINEFDFLQRLKKCQRVEIFDCDSDSEKEKMSKRPFLAVEDDSDTEPDTPKRRRIAGFE